MPDSHAVPVVGTVLPHAADLPLVGGSPPPPPPVDAGPRGIVELRRGQAVALIAGYFGIWVAFFSPIVIVVPAKAEQLVPDDKAAALAAVLGISAVFGILAPPIAGRLSDRCMSRFGRRRPYLLGCLVVGIAALVGDAAASSLAAFIVTFSVGAIAFGVAIAVVLAVMPEHVPIERRGRIGGLLGVAQAMAVVVGVAVTSGLSTHSLAAAFVVPGVVGGALLLWLILTLPDRAISAAERPSLSFAGIAGSFWLDPRRHPDFGWAWLSRFALFMAFAGTVNYQVYYVHDQLGVPSARAASYVAVGTGLQVVLVIVGSAVSGVLSDRVGRRKPFVIAACGLGAVGLLLLAVAPGLPLYFVGLAVAGLGQGAYYAVDLALVSDLLPADREDDARNLGIFSLANQVTTSLAPAIAPLFLAIGLGAGDTGDNYAALFVASAAFAVLAALTIARVRTVR